MKGGENTDKKTFSLILLLFTLLTINMCAAQEIDNSTTNVDDDMNAPSEPVLGLSNDTPTLQASSQQATHIDVASNTTFDVIGDYFKVKLSDSDNKPLKNTKISFTVNGKSYNSNTNSMGIASLQLRLNDGTYKIVTKYAGNSNYKASSLTTTIKMTNTKIVEAGLINSEIQDIIDHAKANNVILFKGSSYSNINLVITKSLTLLSNVGTTLSSSSENPVITIKGKSASLTKVKGFTITGNGDGIEVDGADYVTIYGNEITAGNGIVAKNTKYLNITKNDIVKNSKSGISLADSSYSYIFNNKITNNKLNGIEVAKSDNVFIHGNTLKYNKKNGIYLGKKINGVNYGQGPKDIQINKNTITNNENDGILVQDAGNNLEIKSNTIEHNELNGISLANVGNNVIRSNVIASNGDNGIKFFDGYVMPNIQDISYNAILNNYHMEVEAKDTFYQDGFPFSLGDNWYGDRAGICPKIDTKKIKFTVKQIGPNKYQALFTDSNGNVASLLPDRTLTYTTNDGQKMTITVKGGAAVFTVDAKDGDNVMAIVDASERENVHDLKTKTTPEINGKTPEYSYPAIPQYELYDDIGRTNEQGSGNGQGSGQGTGGNSSQGNGDNIGNSTHSQNMNPSNSASNPVSQSDIAQTTSSQAGASSAGQSNAGSEAQSVVKQIVIDEDEFFKITGISFIRNRN